MPRKNSFRGFLSFIFFVREVTGNDAAMSSDSEDEEYKPEGTCHFFNLEQQQINQHLKSMRKRFPNVEAKEKRHN